MFYLFCEFDGGTWTYGPYGTFDLTFKHFMKLSKDGKIKLNKKEHELIKVRIILQQLICTKTWESSMFDDFAQFN